MKVVSWNLHGSARPDLELVAARLAEFRPDVVGLQEIQPWQARRLARSLGWDHRWTRKHLPFGPFVWWRAEGLAILSPHDLTGHDRIVLNRSNSAFSYRRRVAQRTNVELDTGETVRVVNTHLASHHAPDERAAQAAVVAGWLAAEPAVVVERAVVTGDLNAAGEDTTLVPFTAIGLRDAWDPGQGAGSTNPAGRAYQRLDYVLPGRAWSVIAAYVPPDGAEWARLSDHLPVVAELGPNDPEG